MARNPTTYRQQAPRGRGQPRSRNGQQRGRGRGRGTPTAFIFRANGIRLATPPQEADFERGDINRISHLAACVFPRSAGAALGLCGMAGALDHPSSAEAVIDAMSYMEHSSYTRALRRVAAQVTKREETLASEAEKNGTYDRSRVRLAKLKELELDLHGWFYGVQPQQGISKVGSDAYDLALAMENDPVGAQGVAYIVAAAAWQLGAVTREPGQPPTVAFHKTAWQTLSKGIELIGQSDPGASDDASQIVRKVEAAAQPTTGSPAMTTAGGPSSTGTSTVT